MNCKRNIFYLVTLTFLVFTTACNTTEPIPVDENIKLTEIDAAVIETYLNIHISNPSQSKKVVLERNGQEVMNFTATNTDTAITDTGLAENTLYKYKARLVEGSKVIGESSEVSIRTMQPTSHEFIWQTFTFGEGSSSILYDVAIINENDIWAAGEIYTKDSYTYDSLGNWIDPYNAIHWDGTRWELKRIYYNYNGSKLWGPIKTIFAFSGNDIWFGTNLHWNGRVYGQPDVSVLTGWSANKLWGTSSNNLYAVGNNGNIAWFNGTTWQKIENNVSSEFDFYDVHGKDDNSPIYFIAASLYGNNKIIRLTNNIFEDVPFNEISTPRSIWYSNKYKVYLAGSYFFIYENGKWEKITKLSNQTTTSVRGTGSNDIVIVGTKGIITHLNGITLQSYQTQGEYSAVDIKGNTVVAVGSSRGSEAFIAVGKRN